MPKAAITNKLSQSDIDLFYDIFFSLLDFINKRDRIIPGLLPTIHAFTGQNSLDPAQIKQIASVVWTNPGREIDAYLATADSPKDSEKREILTDWKRCVNGQFFIERHLKSGSVLIGRPDNSNQQEQSEQSQQPRGQAGKNDEDDHVYVVSGLNSSIEEMFPPDYFPLPVLVRATLLPFKGKIITDGLVQRYNIFSGGGIKKMLKETYSEAKKDGRIVTSL